MSDNGPKLDDLRIERSARAAPPARGLAWVFGGLALFAGVVAAWWFLRPRTMEVRAAEARAEVATGGDRTVLNASGYVTARREATVSSKVMGKVMEVLVEEGVSVKAGDVLARLDRANVEASLQLARAQLATAEAARQETRVRLAEAEREFQRQAVLARSNVSAKADYDHAEAAVQAWRARLDQQETERTVADRSLAVWQQQAEDTVIRAPFAGVVTSKNAQPGEMISPMAAGGFTRTGICTIVDMESLEIEVDVNESYINRVRPEQPVEATLDAYPDWRIPCRVIAIIPTADRQKSTVRVRVGFDQLDPRILPQMGVKVAFRDPGGETGAPRAAGVVVPKSALLHQDGRDIVFVLRAGRAERRAVKVAGSTSDGTVLAAGVAAGERVAIEPPAGLIDGAAVKEPKP